MLVHIVGVPGACASGTTDTWRQVASYVAQQLATTFGDQVQVVYTDLFDPACPSLPADAMLPLVCIDGQTVSSGGKLRIPLIRRAIEERLQADGA